MDGENNGKPYFLMDDLGGKPTIFGKHPNRQNLQTAGGSMEVVARGLCFFNVIRLMAYINPAPVDV